jgi:hypothetical protein
LPGVPVKSRISYGCWSLLTPKLLDALTHKLCGSFLTILKGEGAMAFQELTEEQRDKIIDGMIRVLGLERKHPSKEELETGIIDYLGEKAALHPCHLRR